MIAITAFLLFLGLAAANPVDQSLDEVSSLMVKTIAENYDSLSPLGRVELINDFVDIALTEVQNILVDQGMDPLAAPDLHERISFKPIIITYYGELNLTRGWVEGLSTISRNGNVKLDYTNRILSIDVPLHIQNLVIQYDYHAVIMGLGPKGGVEGKTKNVQLRIILKLDFDALQVELKKFDIVKIGKITVKFSGNILLDWLINLLNNTAIILFKWLITWIAEIIIRGTLESVINKINELLGGLVPTGASGFAAAFDPAFPNAIM